MRDRELNRVMRQLMWRQKVRGFWIWVAMRLVKLGLPSTSIVVAEIATRHMAADLDTFNKAWEDHGKRVASQVEA